MYTCLNRPTNRQFVSEYDLSLKIGPTERIKGNGLDKRRSKQTGLYVNVVFFNCLLGPFSLKYNMCL